MNERTLIVTVGTSLFASASWKCEGPFSKVRDYKSWLTDENLKNPGGRRSRGWRTSAALEKVICSDPEGTAAYFDLDVYQPLRYCGEITTLLRVFEQECQGDESFEDFLRRRYPKIRLLASADEENDSNIVARHLRKIMYTILAHPDVEVAAVLRGLRLPNLIRHFREYLEKQASSSEDRNVDLLVTGGYKAYSILAGHWVAQGGGGWRVLYLHEDEKLDLVVEELDAEGCPQMRWGSQSVPVVGWSAETTRE